MKLTILGNNGPFPSAGGACSGYLIQNEENGKKINILIDCGSGVLSNLQKVIKIGDIDAIILTHLHYDHMSDVLILWYAVDLQKRRENINKIIPIFAPEEPFDLFRNLEIKDIFDLNPINSNLVLNFAGLEFKFEEMKHKFKDFAVSIESNKKKFVYSGDTAWCDNIIQFSQNADLLMLDSGLMSKDKKDDNLTHLTAYECGIVAKRANAKSLLLTHIYPGYNLSDLETEAKQNFDETKATRIFEEYVL